MTVAAKPQPFPRWEKVGDLLYRLPVPGGWLYKTTDDSTQHVAIVFVPRPPTAPSDSENQL